MGVLSENLIGSIKLKAFIPLSQNLFESDDLLTLANEELRLKLVGDIFQLREDFFLTEKDVAVTAGIDRIQVPKRSIGNTLKSLWFVSGGVIQRKILPASEEDVSNYSGSMGSPEKYHLEGDEIVLLPTPSVSDGYVRCRYYAKPNLLIETSSCAKITAISSVSGTTTFTVDTDLSADLSVGSTIDLLSAQSPYLLWSEEAAITAITSTTIAVATADVDDANGNVEAIVGDYICPHGYANIPMIPYEFHPVLAQMVAVKLLGGLGDLAKHKLAKEELQEMRNEAEKIIKNRVESAPKMATPSGLIRIFAGG